MNFRLNPSAMLEALPNAMIGWAGVFAVTIVIIVGVCVLNRATSKQNKD